jgi:hypothetical protein
LKSPGQQLDELKVQNLELNNKIEELKLEIKSTPQRVSPVRRSSFSALDDSEHPNGTEYVSVNEWKLQNEVTKKDVENIKTQNEKWFPLVQTALNQVHNHENSVTDEHAREICFQHSNPRV